jgi:hypothetical protein
MRLALFYEAQRHLTTCPKSHREQTAISDPGSADFNLTASHSPLAVCGNKVNPALRQIQRKGHFKVTPTNNLLYLLWNDLQLQ